MDEKITSRENAKIKYACRLSSSAAFRRSEGRFLAEGRKLCPELARGAQLETLFYTEDAMARCPELADLPGEHYLVEDHVADKLADGLRVAMGKQAHIAMKAYAPEKIWDTWENLLERFK